MSFKSFLKAAACLTALQVGAGSVLADDKSPWQIRMRMIDVVPQESSTVSIGGEATADNSLVPEIDITYFWSKHFATELILATSKHNINAVGTALGDVDLGHTWVLPPTLLAQYHFNPDGKLRPYVGAGINYTFFYSEDSGAMDKISYDDGFGFALQGGIDIGLNEHWMLNADVKKIWLNTDVSINDGAVTADVDLNPWVFGVGFGYRF